MNYYSNPTAHNCKQSKADTRKDIPLVPLASVITDEGQRCRQVLAFHHGMRSAEPGAPNQHCSNQPHNLIHASVSLLRKPTA